jgi:hypothetical protein
MVFVAPVEQAIKIAWTFTASLFFRFLFFRFTSFVQINFLLLKKLLPITSY